MGQIVNRRLMPFGPGPDRSYVRETTIDSPIQFPALARAARSDWTGLTTEDHCASLLADARNDDVPHPRQGGEFALLRLWCYYPEIAAQESERRLSSPLTVDNLGVRLDLVKLLSQLNWPKRSAAFQELAYRAMALKIKDAGQLVLGLIEKTSPAEPNLPLSIFVETEIGWWQQWQKKTAAAPWFGKNGPMAGWSNMYPDTLRWTQQAQDRLQIENRATLHP